MKVLLVRHPTTHFQNEAPHVSGIPLGLLYVAAAIQHAGHEVPIYDDVVQASTGDHECREGMYRLGATSDEIRNVVRRAMPDVVGIGSQYTSQMANAIETAEPVKDVDKAITVIVGGSNASVMPSTFLDTCNAVDYVVIGALARR